MFTCTALSSASTANTWSPPATCMYITNSNSPRAFVLNVGNDYITWLDPYHLPPKCRLSINSRWGKGQRCERNTHQYSSNVWNSIAAMCTLPCPCYSHCLTTRFIVHSTVSVHNHCSCVSHCFLHIFSKLSWIQIVFYECANAKCKMNLTLPIVKT